MTNAERDTIKEMFIAINTDFTIQDELKVRQIKNKFIDNFTVDVTKEPEYVFDLLAAAYNEKNADDVEFSLYIGFAFDLFTEDFVDILCKLIEAEWHFRHEDIASILQRLKSPKAVNSLLHCGNNALEIFRI